MLLSICKYAYKQKDDKWRFLRWCHNGAKQQRREGKEKFQNSVVGQMVIQHDKTDDTFAFVLIFLTS